MVSQYRKKTLFFLQKSRFFGALEIFFKSTAYMYFYSQKGVCQISNNRANCDKAWRLGGFQYALQGDRKEQRAACVALLRTLGGGCKSRRLAAECCHHSKTTHTAKNRGQRSAIAENMAFLSTVLNALLIVDCQKAVACLGGAVPLM